MNTTQLFANMSAIHSFFHCLEVEETSINAASLFVKIAFRVGEIIIGEKHLCPPEFCCLPYLICVEPCTSCVCVLYLLTWPLFKARGRKSGVWGGWLVPAGRSADQSPSCPMAAGWRGGRTVYTSREDTAGRPGSEEAAHSHLHAAGQHCGRSLYSGSLVR